MVQDLNDDKSTLVERLNAVKQETITRTSPDQNLGRHKGWLDHNEFSPKADFRIVLGSLKGLFDRIT